MTTQPTVLSDLSGSATAATDGDVVLRVRDLSVRFPSDEGLVNAVSDLSYDARLGRTLGDRGGVRFRQVGLEHVGARPAQPASAP